MKKTTLNQSFWKDPDLENQKKQENAWLKYLNFNDLQSYFVWCERHSFQKTLKKKKYILIEEKQIRDKELQEEAEKNKIHLKNRISQDLRIVKLHEQFEKQVQTNSHLLEAWECLSFLRKNCVYSNIPFSASSFTDHNFLLSGYFKLIHFNELFRVPIKKIKIKKSNPISYFQEVVDQLIGKYPLPKAFLSWWFKPNLKWAQAYVDLCQGNKIYPIFKNIESIPLTHKQIFLLINKFGKQTLFYEKARLMAILETLEAPSQLVSILLRSPLFTDSLDQRFQLKIEYLSFLIKNANFFDWSKTLDLWDYVLHLNGQNQANFSFKNRSLINLIEGMFSWHRSLGKGNVALEDKRVWDKSGISDYHFINEKTKEEVLIKELTSGPDIHAEGKALHHCVYSYVERCLGGRCAIFSMQHKDPLTVAWKRSGTIEVNLTTGKIVQFKAKYNAKPETNAMHHLKLWSNKENLKI